MTVTDRAKSPFELLCDWVRELGVRLQASVESPILDEQAAAEAKQYLDPDFKGWLRGDPRVTMNPVSRYGDDATGFPSGRDQSTCTRDIWREEY